MDLKSQPILPQQQQLQNQRKLNPNRNPPPHVAMLLNAPLNGPLNVPLNVRLNVRLNRPPLMSLSSNHVIPTLTLAASLCLSRPLVANHLAKQRRKNVPPRNANAKAKQSRLSTFTASPKPNLKMLRNKYN